MAEKALMIVDMQNDFIRGSFTVPGGTEIVNPLAALIKSKEYDKVALTEDAHPANHESFSAKLTEVKEAGQRVHYPGEKDKDGNILRGKDTNSNNVGVYPPHCVIGTEGKKIDKNIMQALLDERYSYEILSKGTLYEHFSCLHCQDMRNHIVNTTNDKPEHKADDPLELNRRLVEPMALDHDGLQNRIKIIELFKNTKEIDVVGLSLNHCVISNALSLAKLAKAGFLPNLEKINIRLDLSRGVNGAEVMNKNYTEEMHQKFAIQEVKNVIKLYEEKAGVPDGFNPPNPPYATEESAKFNIAKGMIKLIEAA